MEMETEKQFTFKSKKYTSLLKDFIKTYLAFEHATH